MNGHHWLRADELAERFDHPPDVVRLVYQLVIDLFGINAPSPRILERRYLRLRIGAALVFEQDVVIAVRIERRIEVDKVNGLILDVFPQNL